MTSSISCPDHAMLDSNSRINFDIIREPVKEEIIAVNQLIKQELHSDVVLVNQIGSYIVNSGGKRLRPLLLVLATKALNYTGKQHLKLATAIEFVHTASLLHDDVVDESNLRRGQETVNSAWGNSASVLVGDFLYSRAFEIMVSANNLRVMQQIAETTTALSEGEVLQLLNIHNSATTEEIYLEVISRKTAILFRSAAQLSAILAEAPPAVEESLIDYGLHLGIAFQLIDDVLDYRADPEQTGKNLGDDLAEGKPTLPLIYAIQQSTEEQANVIRKAIEDGNRDAFAEVYQIVESSDAIAYTESRAREEAQTAIESLSLIPPSKYKDAMIALAEFSVQRNY